MNELDCSRKFLLVPHFTLLAIFAIIFLKNPQNKQSFLPLPYSAQAAMTYFLTNDSGVFLPMVYRRSAIQAPRVKWEGKGCFSSWCQTGWYSSPAVINLDSDPQLEILVGTYDLVALDGLTGETQWRATNSNRVWPGVALADLTGDGLLEIIIGRSGDHVSVYDLAGNEVWTRHPFGDGEVRSLAIGDLDDDSKVEIIVGRASGGSTRQVNVFESDGNVRPGFPARRDGEAGYGWGMYNQNLGLANLDGLPGLEIIAPTDTHYITALDQNGNQLPAHFMYNAFNPQGNKVWSQVGVHVEHAVDLRGYAQCGIEHRPNFADSPPSLADLDGNGSIEIVVIGNVYNCGSDPYTSLYQMPFIFKFDRSRWSSGPFDWTAIPLPDSASAPLSEQYQVIETVSPAPVLADLDSDGFLEIVYASYDGRVHAYWLDKKEHGQWPFSVNDPGEGLIRFASEPVIADLDNDSKAEVIFTSWTQKNSGRTGKLHLLSHTGEVLYEIDLPNARNGGWNGAMAAPTLADIDQDGELEITVNTAHSGVVVYDLPRTAGYRLLWPTGRGNFWRNGLVVR